MKLFIGLCLIGLVSFAYGKSTCLGCQSDLNEHDLKEIEGVVNSSLSKLAAGDGPAYKLVKINSAKKQVVSGTKYDLNVELEDNENNVKNCNIDIWSKPWLKNGTQIALQCPGERVKALTA